MQIRAKTAISRGSFAGIRQCRETTAHFPVQASHSPPDRAKRPVTTLTRQGLAPHRSAALHSIQASESVFTLS
ncbi:TPA: hypothetical protein QDE50_37900 [Burkholderia cenocepacia]|nr:hypothetical protein [Burkholderia cenocepacia]HDR9882729.1 hypothetical protein [Burkholderia cenocepacia]HDR9884056.1 hypothetical protein [Burkholderia cenocepacia]HDR9890091.1 hypothetical protein [Burkholderia cenocepacia]